MVVVPFVSDPTSLKPLLDEPGREAQAKAQNQLLDWAIKVLLPTVAIAGGVSGIVGGAAGYVVASDVERGGTIAVTSKPSPSRVTVDGRIVGKTPTERLEVDPGTHAVVVESLGYEPFLDNVKVRAALARRRRLRRRSPSEMIRTRIPRARSRYRRAIARDEKYRCESGCRDAAWSCEGRSGCVSSMTYEQCRSQCDASKQGCKQKSDFCEQGCKTNYDNCSRY